MARRLQAVADVELVQLAKLAAASEAQPGGTIEQLKAAALLPPEFGPLPDGSRVVLAGGEVYDSLRGRRGAFLPVSDMPVGKITRAERSRLRQVREFYRAQWGRMDPMIAGVKRTAMKDNREQVVVDVLMSPLAPQHFEMLEAMAWPGRRPSNWRRLPATWLPWSLVLTGQRIFAGLARRGPAADRRHG